MFLLLNISIDHFDVSTENLKMADGCLSISISPTLMNLNLQFETRIDIYSPAVPLYPSTAKPYFWDSLSTANVEYFAYAFSPENICKPVRNSWLVHESKLISSFPKNNKSNMDLLILSHLSKCETQNSLHGIIVVYSSLLCLATVPS